MDDPPPLGISFSIATAAAAVLLLLSSPTARIDFLLLLLLPAGDRKRGGGERPVVGSEWVWVDGWVFGATLLGIFGRISGSGDKTCSATHHRFLLLYLP